MLPKHKYVKFDGHYGKIVGTFGKYNWLVKLPTKVVIVPKDRTKVWQ